MGEYMKTAFYALALTGASFVATQSTAGSIADPVVEPVVITDDATSSSSGTGLVAALALLMILPVAD